MRGQVEQRSDDRFVAGFTGEQEMVTTLFYGAMPDPSADDHQRRVAQIRLPGSS